MFSHCYGSIGFEPLAPHGRKVVSAGEAVRNSVFWLDILSVGEYLLWAAVISPVAPALVAERSSFQGRDKIYLDEIFLGWVCWHRLCILAKRWLVGGTTVDSPRGVWRRLRSRSRTPPRSSTASSSSRVRPCLPEPEPEPEPGEDLTVRTRIRDLANLQVDQRPLDFNVFGGRSH